MIVDDEIPVTEENIKRARLLIGAAFWVSKMDPQGGYNASVEERKAITETLRRFMGEKDYREISPVFDAALENYKAWDSWTKDLSNFRYELQTILADVPLSYRQSVYDLAYCVAIRYRERNFILATLASIHVSLKNFLAPDPHRIDLPDYLNISPTEKSALNELAEILNLPQRIIV
ncbi:MAG: hypothetical protein DI586_01040 [Micavibrio aeruginosavorus]|uniref:Uncharacterized protein n=1 Tax=Micavibrio aeruginosavorus TaxID=349221 RepID=A0A2W5FTQ0_9BACT|nr:MAG: hypothetical protein DI586_01040 [Micavibrio aeruginosavorus]